MFGIHEDLGPEDVSRESLANRWHPNYGFDEVLCEEWCNPGWSKAKKLSRGGWAGQGHWEGWAGSAGETRVVNWRGGGGEGGRENHSF